MLQTTAESLHLNTTQYGRWKMKMGKIFACYHPDKKLNKEEQEHLAKLLWKSKIIAYLER